MKFLLLLLLLLISTVSSFTIFNRKTFRAKRSEEAEESLSDTEATKYLHKFGYIKPAELVFGTSSSSEDFETWAGIQKNAVKAFQDFAGLKRTGKLDEKTKDKMTEPRCGVADIQNLRLSSYMPWKNKEITYAILSFSSDLSENDVKSAIRRAFDIWSAKIPRIFREVPSTDSKANIKIEFGKGSHGDPWPFDGKGGILAHGAINGILHFDDDEIWKRYSKAEKVSESFHDLLSVALHETGHVLGLDHTRVEGSVMAPFYLQPVDGEGNYVEPRLLLSDIVDIQEIYGEKAKSDETEFTESQDGTTANPSENWQPDDCPSPQKNKDIAVSDIKSVKGPLSDCCDICKITPKCKAYSWNDWEGGTCWLKSATGPVIDLYGVSLGIL